MDKNKKIIPISGKKTKENAEYAAPTVQESKMAAEIALSAEECHPFSVEEMTAIIDLIAPPNTTGIGRQPIFRTNQWPTPQAGGLVPSFQPVQIIKALLAYMFSTITLKEALIDYEIPEATFRSKVLVSYPEVSSLLDLANARKATAYMDEAQGIMLGDIPDEYFEDTNHGRRLTSAGIQHINNKTNFLVKRAQMSERQAYNDRVELKVTHQVNSRAEAIDLDEFRNVPIGDLATLL